MAQRVWNRLEVDGVISEHDVLRTAVKIVRHKTPYEVASECPRDGDVKGRDGFVACVLGIRHPHFGGSVPNKQLKGDVGLMRDAQSCIWPCVMVQRVVLHSTAPDMDTWCGCVVRNV